MEISISITSDIKAFVESKGWTKKLTTFQESAVEGRVKVEQDNPISAEQFCSDYFKRIVVSEFANHEIGLINKSFDTQKKAQIELIQSDLNNNIIVESK